MEQQEQTKESKKFVNKNFGYEILILGAVSLILTLPPFIFLYKYFPTMQFYVGNSIIKLDYIILFLSLFFLLFYLLKKFKLIVVGIVLAGLLAMTVTNFSNIYTFGDLQKDYYAFLFDISGNSFEENFVIEGGKFQKEKELRKAIDYTNPSVRNYAASIAIKHFDDKAHFSSNRRWVHFLSVFKEIYGQWKYVFDPANEDYYSKASETLMQLNYDEYFKGDCDDYSIMMAACIKAIGGEVRLVRTTVKRTNGKDIGHLYPEVKFGNTDDLETLVYLIKNIYFSDESKGKPIHYFEDNQGFIWLNFDYNDKYPGGKYQSEIRESEIVI